MPRQHSLVTLDVQDLMALIEAAAQDATWRQISLSNEGRECKKLDAHEFMGASGPWNFVVVDFLVYGPKRGFDGSASNTDEALVVRLLPETAAKLWQLAKSKEVTPSTL